MIYGELLKSSPPIDQMAGMDYYCTEFRGTGGSIKQGTDSFRVYELVADSLLTGISHTFDDTHRYPLYILEKEGIDSNHALMEIDQVHRMRLRVMGIKDAKAVTRQYASAENARKDPPRKLETSHTRLLLQGFTRKPIGKELLSGNKFEIKIDGSSGDVDNFIQEAKKIANFYGLQRFGSERQVTHLVGREIVKRNFGSAVRLLLCHTTEYDSLKSREIRRKCEDPANYKTVLKEIPRGMDIERLLLNALVDGKDPIVALRAVPITIRRLFVQAFQSFIFNRCMSDAIKNGEDILCPRDGDLCFEMEGEWTFGRVRKYDTSGKKMLPAAQLIGYAFQARKGRFEIMTQRLLEEEGLTARDFYIKDMQELSQQGGFRQTPLWCRNIVFARNPFTISFDLPKGSYATVLLRELIKPEDPIAAGF